VALVAFAMGAALFEHGGDLAVLAAVQGAGILWLARGLWAGYAEGLRWRPAALSVALFAFWIWLGAGILITSVTFVSVLAFWTLGSVPLFHVASLTELRSSGETGWRRISCLLCVLAAVVAIHGIWQRVVLQEQGHSLFLNPRSYEAFLNLLLLPVAAALLHASDRQGRAARRKYWLLAALATLVLYAQAGNGGRGSALGLWVAIALLFFLVRRQVSRQALARLLALVVAVYGLAALTVPNSVGRASAGLGSVAAEALALAARPADSLNGDTDRDSQRLVIWRGAIELWRHSPWYGTGPGTFWLTYRPYREPQDASAGQHAHNDYLELLIELGWPGLALLLLVMASATRTALGAVHNARLTASQRMEAAGLLAGLGAIAVHSLFSFNFYLPPVLIAIALYSGRLRALAERGGGLKIWRPSRWVGRRAYRVMVLGMAAIPLSQLGGIAVADARIRQANQQMARAEFESSGTNLRRAFRAFATDRPLLELARIYIRGVRTMRDEAARRHFFNEGIKLLDRAAEVNPLRAYTPLLRAALIESGADAGDPVWQPRAVRAYRHALALDPRQWVARAALAQLLLKQGQRADAVRVVEAGLRFARLAEPSALPFYGLAVRLAMERGDSAGAAAVYQDMKRISNTLHLTPESLAAFGIEAWIPVIEALPEAAGGG